MTQIFFDEVYETVDFIRGIGSEHFHFKENIVFLKDCSFIAKTNTEIQRGDVIFQNDNKLFVFDFKIFDDYVLFKTRSK